MNRLMQCSHILEERTGLRPMAAILVWFCWNASPMYVVCTWYLVPVIRTTGIIILKATQYTPEVVSCLRVHMYTRRHVKVGCYQVPRMFRVEAIHKLLAIVAPFAEVLPTH